MSSHQPVETVGNRPLGTQAAPVCEGGVSARDRLMTADCSWVTGLLVGSRRQDL